MYSSEQKIHWPNSGRRRLFCFYSSISDALSTVQCCSVYLFIAQFYFTADKMGVNFRLGISTSRYSFHTDGAHTFTDCHAYTHDSATRELLSTPEPHTMILITNCCVGVKFGRRCCCWNAQNASRTARYVACIMFAVVL